MEQLAASPKPSMPSCCKLGKSRVPWARQDAQKDISSLEMDILSSKDTDFCLDLPSLSRICKICKSELVGHSGRDGMPFLGSQVPIV